MPEQWYWKHRGDLLGPLDTADLEQLIQRRRVADRDQIRLTTSDEWMSGAQIKALFARRSEHDTPSEAAAALLDRSIHPQQLRDAAAGGGVIGDAATGARTILKRALGALGSVGGPVSQLAAGGIGRLMEAGEGLGKLLVHRAVILALVAIAFNVVVIMQRQQGSDARNRIVLEELTAAWDQWQTLGADGQATDEREAYRDEALPKWDATLNSLTRDAHREAMPSSSPFATSGGQRSTAAMRRALIQAIQEFKLVLSAPTDEERPSRSTADFQTHLSMARQVLDNNYEYYRPKWTPQDTAYLRSEIAASLDPWILAVVVLDAGLVVLGLWTWLRRVRA